MEIKYGDVSLKVSDIKFRRQKRPVYTGFSIPQLARSSSLNTREDLLYYISETQKHLLAFPDLTAGHYYLALWRLLMGKNMHDTGLEHVRYYYPIFDEAVRAGARFVELEPKKDAGYYLLEKIFLMMEHRATEARTTGAGPDFLQYEPVNDPAFQKRLLALIAHCPNMKRRERLQRFIRGVMPKPLAGGK